VWDAPRAARAAESAAFRAEFGEGRCLAAARRQVARWSTSGMQTGGNSGDRLCALPKEE
jgi:hypothetical protein